VDFLREPVVDEETGEVIDAHPSNYEAVPGGLPEIRSRVEGLQRRFNEETKVRQCCGVYMLQLSALKWFAGPYKALGCASEQHMRG
jgi:hypothetical protein